MSDLTQFERFSKKWLIWFALITVVVWSWFGFIVGIDTTAILYYLMIVGLAFTNKTTRKLFIVFAPFFIYLFFYISLKVLHEYNTFPIHLEDLYQWEVDWFGVEMNGQRVSINEYFNENLNTFSDIFSGLFYVTWVPFPIIFVFIVYFNNKRKIGFDYWLSFLFANLIGFMGYIFYPAAPPWYFLEYGNELLQNMGGSAAGLARFDEFIGYPLYTNLYTQGTNTFGAMPSMHAAFPLILVFYSLKFKNWWVTSIAFISLIGIWYGAVYTSHHYVIDIIFGGLCGILGIIITEFLVNRKFVPDWYQKAVQFIG